MRNPPIFRLKQDRRDPVVRASTSRCPACGAAEPEPLTRTAAAVYFGCEACGHLWNLPKRESLASPTIEYSLMTHDSQ
jgi:hypothetical protein